MSRIFLLAFILIVMVSSCKKDGSKTTCKNLWQFVPEVAEDDEMIKMDTNDVYLAMTNPYPPSYGYSQSYTGIKLYPSLLTMSKNFNFEFDYSDFNCPDSLGSLQITFETEYANPGQEPFAMGQLTIKNYVAIAHFFYLCPDTSITISLNAIPEHGKISFSHTGESYTLSFKNSTDSLSLTTHIVETGTSLQPKISINKPHLGKCSVFLDHFLIDSDPFQNYQCIITN